MQGLAVSKSLTECPGGFGDPRAWINSGVRTRRIL